MSSIKRACAANISAKISSGAFRSANESAAREYSICTDQCRANGAARLEPEYRSTQLWLSGHYYFASILTSS